MAQRSTGSGDELHRVQRTTAGRVWVALVPALVILVLLIVFIAENGKQVEVSFFGAKGHLPLALALLIAAVTGAAVVLLAGSVRIIQLRRATNRHRRAGAGRSVAAASADEAVAVEAHHDSESAGP